MIDPREYDHIVVMYTARPRKGEVMGVTMTWTIVTMSPEAACAAVANLLEREGALAWHIRVVRDAWRPSSVRERIHLWRCLRAARRAAPSAEASLAIDALLVKLDGMSRA